MYDRCNWLCTLHNALFWDTDNDTVYSICSFCSFFPILRYIMHLIIIIIIIIPKMIFKGRSIRSSAMSTPNRSRRSFYSRNWESTLNILDGQEIWQMANKIPGSTRIQWYTCLLQWRSQRVQPPEGWRVQPPLFASKPFFFHSRKVTVIKYYNVSLTTRRAINSHDLRKTNHLGGGVLLLAW